MTDTRTHWTPTTDTDFPEGFETAASGVYDALTEYGAGEAEVSGFSDATGDTDEGEGRKVFSVVVAQHPDKPKTPPIAIHVDWKTQTIVTAWYTP